MAQQQVPISALIEPHILITFLPHTYKIYLIIQSNKCIFSNGMKSQIKDIPKQICLLTIIGFFLVRIKLTIIALRVRSTIWNGTFLEITQSLNKVPGLTLPKKRFFPDTLYIKNSKYRVINKEGEKVNTFYTPKNCILGSLWRFIFSRTYWHLIICIKVLKYFT